MKQLALFLLGVPLWGFAQNEAVQSTKDRLNYGDVKLRNNSSNLFYGFDTRTSEIKGDYYLNSEWSEALVKFYPRNIETPKGIIRLDTLPNVLVRYNLFGNDIEFKTPDGIKIVSGAMIQEIQFYNQPTTPKLHSTLDYIDNSEKIKPGFFKVLVDGKIQLLEYTEVKIRKPDYVPSLNLGDEDTQIIKNKVLYITQGKEVIRFRKRRKDLLLLMEDKRSEVIRFIRKEQLFIRNLQDLTKIFSFYNSL
ncbi:MAG: hypothetical protein ACK4NY_14605 [Spirosomataceae bacterium]